jgi:hypothetical protein
MSFLLLSVLDIFPNKPWVWKRGARDALFRMPHAVLQPIYFMLFSDVEYKVSVATSPLSRHATTLSRTKSLRSRVHALLRVSKSFFGHIMYRSLRFKLVCMAAMRRTRRTTRSRKRHDRCVVSRTLQNCIFPSRLSIKRFTIYLCRSVNIFSCPDNFQNSWTRHACTFPLLRIRIHHSMFSCLLEGCSSSNHVRSDRELGNMSLRALALVARTSALPFVEIGI